MMQRRNELHDHDSAPDLLGYHLGLIEAEARPEVERALGGPAETRAACARLQQWLTLLDADAPAPAPRDLADGILQRVGRQRERVLPLVLPASGSESRGMRGGPLLTFREVASLAAAILLFVGIFVPGYHRARTRAQMAACANNLRVLGTGYSAYAQANAGQLPFAGAQGPWYQPGTTGRPALGNSRHVFRLVKGGYLQGTAMICPGREADFAFEAVDPVAHDDFSDPRNNSYATSFVTGSWPMRTVLPDMPFAADMTPLVDGNRRLIRTGNPPANSVSHGRPGGQTVLRANISVGFFNRPNVGVQNDDIYRLKGVTTYNGLERPTSRSDAFLVP